MMTTARDRLRGAHSGISMSGAHPLTENSRSPGVLRKRRGGEKVRATVIESRIITEMTGIEVGIPGIEIIILIMISMHHQDEGILIMGMKDMNDQDLDTHCV